MSQIHIHTKYVMDLTKLSETEANEIVEVIDNEWLVDWSEATKTGIRNAVRLARMFIANGNSWEVEGL